MANETKTPVYANPFRTLADLVLGLKRRLLAEVDKPDVAEVDSLLEGMNNLIEESTALAKQLEQLEQQNHSVFHAMQRALER